MLWFSSRPTYLHFRINLLVMFQNTYRNQQHTSGRSDIRELSSNWRTPGLTARNR